MRSAVYVLAVLGLALNASALPVTEVESIPGHPLADVMGMVLSTDGSATELSIDSWLDSPLNPPYQPGWPIDFSSYTGDEGALLVNADSDPEMEVLFRIHKTVHLMNHDGTYVTGWPVTPSSGSHSTGQPSFGDIDGDGEGEIIMVTDLYPNGSYGWTWAYHTDGTIVSGFPVQTFGDHTKSPTVVDIYGDGSCEIIVSDRDYPIGHVYIIDGAGQILTGWPQELNHVPAASAGAADVDNDGEREIFFQSYNSIYGWNADGTPLAGFPYTPPSDVFSYSAPTFADVDDDGYLEIASGGHSMSGSSHMFLLNHDGTPVTGWPKAVQYWIYAPATFADMDGDDDLEILVGDQVLSPTLCNYLFAWHHDGTTVAGWPVGPIEAVNAQVAVADIDGDVLPEFVWDTNITPGKLHGYNHDGTVMSGWPITTDGASFFNTVAFGDVDLDGDMELLLNTYLDTPLSTIHLWDLPDQVDPMDIQMPMFQYNPGRDGLIYDPESQGFEGSVSSVQAIMSAAPNPFTSSVVISVAGFEGDPGTLRIFDLSGREVAELEPSIGAGQAYYSWDVDNASLSPGVYCARVVSGGSASNLMLLKLR